jgi:hypothetical protein
MFLGLFAKSPKVTISFVMSVRPFAGVQQIGSHWTDFNNFLEMGVVAAKAISWHVANTQ